MKKTALLLVIITVLLAAAGTACAFGKKGYVPGADQLVYRALKVTEDGVSLVLKNRSDKTVVFNASLSFLNKRRKEVGDIYIEKTSIEPGREAVFKDLYLKGDYDACRKAESLRWTIYALEVSE